MSWCVMTCAPCGREGVGDVDDAPVGQLLDLRARSAEIAGEVLRQALRLGRRVAAVLQPVVQDFSDGRSRPDVLGREAVHLGVQVVAHDEALLVVEHGKTLRHVVQGAVELLVLLLELSLQLFALGDVLMRRDPAAPAHRRARDANGAPVAQVVNRRRCLVERRKALVDIGVRIGAGIEAVGNAVLDDLAQRRAGLDLRGREPVDLAVAVVGDYYALVRIEHAQAVRHVLQGRVETLVLRFQLLFALLQQLVLFGEAGVQSLALGDVLVRTDEAAIGHRPAQHGYEAAVAQPDDLGNAIAEPGETSRSQPCPRSSSS